MTNNERKSVWNTGTESGFRNSTNDSRSQVNNSGVKITHIGENRTKVGTTTYFGASAAKKAIKGY